jgi:hypothetical protein
MKRLLPFLFLALTLSNCKKGSDDPAPAPTATMIATWEWESESLVTVYKDGRPTTTQNKTVVPKSVYVTFGSNGYATTTTNGVAAAPVPYTLKQVGVPATSTDRGYAVTETLTELTTTHMTYVIVNENSSVKYTTTDTYKR